MNTFIERKNWITPILLLLVLSVSISSHAQETYTWKTISMGGAGFVTGIVTSKTTAGLVYARTDVGGAYRWNDTIGKWIPLLDWVNEDELGYMGVESIAIDPVEANKVYLLVGTSYFNGGKTAILRSSDYGNSFTITDVSTQFRAHGNGMGRQTGEKLVVDPNSTNVLYCGSRSNGLFKSTTSGGTWSKINSLTVPTATNGGNGISFVILDPSTGSTGSPSQTIITGISVTGTNLYRSDNGGTTFTAIAGGPTTLMPHRAVLASDRDLYITYASAAGPWDITGAGQVWKYNLATEAWTNVTPPAFTGAYGGISVDPANPNRLVASSINSYWTQDNSYGDRIFLTTNGGTNWTDVVAAGFDLDPNGINWVNGHAIHWAGCVEFDPFDTKKAWIISGNGVFKTDDIDAALNVWKFTVNGLEETVPFETVSIPNGPLLSVIGDYDGFRHTNVEEYAPIHSPQMGSTYGISAAPLNPNVVLRIGEQKIFYSDDMGVSWEESVRSTTQTKGNTAISADGEVFLHSVDASNTYRSSDHGLTWVPVTGLPIRWSRPIADPIDPEIFYAYNNSNGIMMVSTDKGVSFAASGSPGTGGSMIIRATPYRKGDLWVAMNGGGLKRSANGGESFTTIAGVTQCAAVGFGKEAPESSFPTLYIYGTIGGIRGVYRSIDEGDNWLRVNDNNHEYGGLGNGQFVNGDMNVFGRVYMSTVGRGIVYGESSETCIPTNITPYSKVDSEDAAQTSYLTVDAGNDIQFLPEAPEGGSWNWTGPDSFSSEDQDQLFENVQLADAGVYFVQYTNAEGCTSAWQSFTIDIPVKATSILVKGANDQTAVSEDSTLQMLVVFTPGNTSNQQVVWSLSTSSELATISSDGLLTPVAPGVVTVRATATDGSDVYGETEIIIDAVVAVEYSLEKSISLYPNPSSKMITVHRTSDIKNITILDVMGKSIRVFENTNRLDKLDLNVQDLSAGFYYLEIRDKAGRTAVKRLVKK